MTHYKYLAAAALLLLLAACGSNYGNAYPPYSTYSIRGTVDYVDTSNQFVQLYDVTSANGAMTSNYGGDNVRVYYTGRTPVNYNGNNYRPQDLERGDQVSVTVAPTVGNRLNAESMNVIYNVRASYPGNYPNQYPASSPSTYPNTYPGNGYPTGSLHGTVRYVDARHDTITVDTSNGAQTLAYYSGMPVYYNGQTYRPQDLQPGDQVDIQYNDLGNGNLQAQSINVTYSVSGGNGTYGSTSNYATIRGTVDSVDTYGHLITLRSTNYVSGFNRNVGSRMTVQYDANTRVNINGQLYPVEGLQRGDIIDVQLQNPGATTPFVQSITLFRDINQRY